MIFILRNPTRRSITHNDLHTILLCCRWLPPNCRQKQCNNPPPSRSKNLRILSTNLVSLFFSIESTHHMPNQNYHSHDETTMHIAIFASKLVTCNIPPNIFKRTTTYIHTHVMQKSLAHIALILTVVITSRPQQICVSNPWTTAFQS